MSEKVIGESNFDKYFFDVRKHKLQKGQIMACYTAVAEFIESVEKRHLIELLFKKNKAESATAVMRKLHFASQKDAVSVPKRIAEDLISGMSVDEVLKKPYKYIVEMFFYCDPADVPKDDPHWSSISIHDLTKDDGVIRTKINYPNIDTL